MKNNPSILDTKDYFLTQEQFSIIKTQIDGVLQTVPVPGNIWAYYDSKKYLSHTINYRSPVGILYAVLQKFNNYLKYQLLKGISNKGDILLDYGAGTGAFANFMGKKGWKTYAYEPYPKALTPKNSILVNQITDLQQIKGRIKVVTLWHVLEHTQHPEELLTNLIQYIENNGYLIIALPNYQSLDAKYYKNFWAAYDVPRHLWHFSEEGIKKLTEQKGVQHIATKRQLIDAYYISLLSETYRKKSFKLIRAFIIGSLSNLMSIASKNSSSKIYIFQKSS